MRRDGKQAFIASSVLRKSSFAMLRGGDVITQEAFRPCLFAKRNSRKVRSRCRRPVNLDSHSAAQGQATAANAAHYAFTGNWAIRRLADIFGNA
jgi:hypothetical protein